MRLTTKLFGLLAACSAVPVYAQDTLEIIGKPKERGIDFQPAASDLAREIQSLDNLVFYIITAISIFVMILLLFCTLLVQLGAQKAQC